MCDGVGGGEPEEEKLLITLPLVVGQILYSMLYSERIVFCHFPGPHPAKSRTGTKADYNVNAIWRQNV